MSVTVWYVAFVPARAPRHVLAFGFDPVAGVWVRVNPLWNRTDVAALPPARFDRWVRRLAARADVWRAPVRNERPHPCPACLCVGQIKRLLGFRSGAFFPAGLRRDLVRAGARPAFRKGSG